MPQQSYTLAQLQQMGATPKSYTLEELQRMGATPVATAAAPHSDDRTATEVLQDQAAHVLKGIPQSITGIPAAVAAVAGTAWEALQGRHMRTLELIKGMLQPVTTSVRGAAAYVAPNTVAAPSRQDFEQAAEGSGALLAGTVLPEVVSRVASARVPPLLKSRLNPTEQAAVAFADREGIPVDAATRTGSKVARGVQKLVQESPGGAGVASDARAAQTTALTETADRLKNQVEPRLGGASYTPETAVDAVTDSVKARIARFNTKAGDAYDLLRQAEQDPANAKTIIGADGTAQQVPLAADLRGVKQALQPIYDEILQRMPIAQQQMNPGLKAIENILSSEDFVPASIADSNLGAIKSIARDTSSPQARRLAMKAIDELDAEVKLAVSAAGPDAVRALERGRALTRAKYKATDLLESLKAGEGQTYEPAATFKTLAGRDDTHVNLLRKVADQVPQDLPKLGRAYLEGLFDTATEEGGFGRTDGLFRNWQNLGDESKALLFPNQLLRTNLDSFLLLAKRIAENPNPSGTASVLQIHALVDSVLGSTGMLLFKPEAAAVGYAGVTSYVIGSRALAKMLFSPNGSKALMHGLRVPLGNKAAATLAANQILSLAGKENVTPLGANPGPQTATPALVPAQ